MDEEIMELLEQEIRSEFQDLSALEPGSKEKSAAVDDLVKLYRLKMEEIKTDLEFEEKRKKRFAENGQMREQVKDRYFRLGIAAAEIVLPLIFYAAWMRRGFRFEETGTFTSTTFKGLFNRFKPTKKN